MFDIARQAPIARSCCRKARTSASSPPRARLERRGLAQPMLLGAPDAVARSRGDAEVSLDGIEVRDPRSDAALPATARALAAARETMTPAWRAAAAQAALFRRHDGAAGRRRRHGGRRRQSDAARDRGRPDDRRPGAGHRPAVELFPHDRAGCSARARALHLRRLRRQRRSERRESWPTSPSPRRAARRACSARRRAWRCCRSRPTAAPACARRQGARRRSRSLRAARARARDRRRAAGRRGAVCRPWRQEGEGARARSPAGPTC